MAKGGRGGLGNAHFATSTNRAPRKVQPGEPGEEFDLQLQLKLLADVGLVGFPNAGKSHADLARSRRPSRRSPNYPFTTLTPNLGVVALSDDRSFVVADVPGLIEGAHAGHGLGHQFLRHIERTKVLVHLVDVSGESGRDPVEDFDTIRRELELYNPSMLQKPQVVVANKIDAVDDPNAGDRAQKRAQEAEAAVLPDLRRDRRRRAGAARSALLACRLRARRRDLAERDAAVGRRPDGRGLAPRHDRRPRWASSAARSIPFTSATSRRPARRRPRWPWTGCCSSRPTRRHIDLTARAHPGIIDCEMTALAVGRRARLGRRPISSCVRDGPSYTFDTLTALADRRARIAVFLHHGADAFAEIATWRRYPDVLELAHFVVVARPGTSFDHLRSRLPPCPSRMVACERPRIDASARRRRPRFPGRSRHARRVVHRDPAPRRAPASRSPAWCPIRSRATSPTHHLYV